jgi:hypothetical protein
MKSQIVEQLGQSDILLPSLIAEGLAANDRVKLRMSALQAVPNKRAIPLGRSSTLEPNATPPASIPRRSRLSSAARISLQTAGSLPRSRQADRGRACRRQHHDPRRSGWCTDRRRGGGRALVRAPPAATLGADNEIETTEMAKLSGVSEDGADSLHRLVMDLHKAQPAGDRMRRGGPAGAHVYGLQPGDRPVVEAFMRGVEETRGEIRSSGSRHDGNAFRDPARHQNDIGATDAHVVVIAVEGNAVTMTYTDVHLVRAKFSSPCSTNFACVGAGLIARPQTGLAWMESSIW